jgi:hypothetical protein
VLLAPLMVRSSHPQQHERLAIPLGIALVSGVFGAR